MGDAGEAGANGGTQPGDPFRVEYQLASDVNPDAPGTVGIVTFTSPADALVSAEILFGLDRKYGMSAPVDLTDPIHRTLLLGMKPARAYHFQIVARTATRTYVSADHVINTGPPTDLVSLADFDIRIPAQHDRGFIVTSYWVGPGSGVPFIIDADGEIVWWATGGPAEITRASMSADGKNMWLTVPGARSGDSGAPLHRISMDTLDSETYLDTRGTHDITPVTGDVMAYIDYGEPDCSSIFEIDNAGTIREIFESSDFIVNDNCHGNAVRYYQPRDLYVFSELNQDILFINRSDGSVEWRLSERVSGGNAAWGGRSHGVHLLPDSVLMFANFGAANGKSAAIEYSLAGAEIARFEGDLLTTVMGDVQRLPGGNTLIGYPVPSIMQEVNSSGEVVLQIDGGGPIFGYAVWRRSLYGPSPDIMQ